VVDVEVRRWRAATGAFETDLRYRLALPEAYSSVAGDPAGSLSDVAAS